MGSENKYRQYNERLASILEEIGQNDPSYNRTAAAVRSADYNVYITYLSRMRHHERPPVLNSGANIKALHKGIRIMVLRERDAYQRPNGGIESLLSEGKSEESEPEPLPDLN